MVALPLRRCSWGIMHTFWETVLVCCIVVSQTVRRLDFLVPLLHWNHLRLFQFSTIQGQSVDGCLRGTTTPCQRQQELHGIRVHHCIFNTTLLPVIQLDYTISMFFHPLLSVIQLKNMSLILFHPHVSMLEDTSVGIISAAHHCTVSLVCKCLQKQLLLGGRPSSLPCHCSLNKLKHILRLALILSCYTVILLAG